jgi:hypothetical protein
MTNKKTSQKKSFDDSTKLMIDTLKQRVTDASNQRNVAQTVVLALTSRQTTAQGLLARAQSSAASAEQTFHDGQVVTQTVLNGFGHAKAALGRAEAIRNDIRLLYEKSYSSAVLAVQASQSVEDFVFGVNSYKAKNEYFSSDVVAAMPDILNKAQTALSAALTAVQSSMLALASAEEAVLSAETVTREAKILLKHLLPKAIENYPSGPVTNLREYPLYQASPPSLGLLVQNLDQAAPNGLLFLLDAIRQIRDFSRNEMNDLNSEIGMELNAAKHALDKADKLYSSLQASLAAASVAV